MWLIDGSNVLGALRADLAAVDAKRELTRRVASFARSRRSRATCFFDGPEPHGFARHLGNVTVVFAGKRSADDLIAEQASAARNAKVVTSDRALGARVASRQVEVITSQQFIRQLQERGESPDEVRADDWESWFSDPKNREKF